MNILIGLIAISLSMAIGFLGIFLWNLRHGQYDDTVTPAIRMLFEDKTGTSADTGTDKDHPAA